MLLRAFTIFGRPVLYETAQAVAQISAGERARALDRLAAGFTEPPRLQRIPDRALALHGPPSHFVTV